MTASVDPRAAPSTSSIFSVATHALLWTLVALHLLQLATPLRLNTDAVRLLTMADQKAATGVLPHEQFPPLFPSAVALLVGLGLERTLWLVLFNYAALAMGLLAWAATARDFAAWSPAAIRLGASVFLSSWVVIKHATIPLTEPLFFAAANLALYIFCRARASDSTFGWWFLAVVVAVAAALTRTIGIALAGAALLALFERPSKRRTWALVFGGSGLVLAVGVLFWWQWHDPTSYLRSNAARLSHDTFSRAWSTLQNRALELGQLATNVPESAARPTAPLQLIAGVVVAALLLVGAWRSSRALRPVAGYLATYLAILLVWAYSDPRFWLPLLPWLALIFPVATAGRTRWLLAGATAIYLGFGIVALGYSTQLTFSEPDSFARHYAVSPQREAYEFAFGLRPAPDPIADRPAIAVLQRHEPLARNSARLAPATPGN